MRGPILIGFLSLVVVVPQLQAQTLDARWAELTSADEATASRALLALAATPKDTLAYLQDHLQPVKADPKRVAALIKQLDSNKFVERAQATAELEYLGKYIKADLEAALKKDLILETKMRIQKLIEKMPVEKKVAPPMPAVIPKGRSVSVSNINGQIQIMIDGKPLDLTPPAPLPPPPGPPATWIRATRAITLLEHMNTSESRALIQAIANGEADALPTIAARDALKRLQK